jgi:predicted GNAT family acetyltransferase
MKMESEIINNEHNMQFEYRENGQLARLEYRFYKKNIAMMHTVVPETLKGKGIASALAKHAFSFAKSRNKKVMIYCPFVASYLMKHPELKEQLDRVYHQNL